MERGDRHLWFEMNMGNLLGLTDKCPVVVGETLVQVEGARDGVTGSVGAHCAQSVAVVALEGEL